MKKIKVLFDTETTGALSGFGKYGRELLKRLSKFSELEIAEFASFGTMYDNKYAHVNWRYYPNAVDGNHPESKSYESDVRNKYGAWRFDRVCLDFQPDFVVSWKDPWMIEHLFQSPLRPFYHLACMPTVDSAPQQPQWIEMFREADSIFTYSDWAIPVLSEQSGGDIKAVCSTYPGVDLELFRPMDRNTIRDEFGVPKEHILIGMVCRNQRRKLLPELFKMFRLFLDKYGNTEIGKRCYLYLHTSYPDVGWDLPALLNEFNIANRVYFTYFCNQSRQPMVAKFEGARTHSSLTNSLSAQFPNVGNGLSEEQLGKIFNLFDLYIQYANCEGSGMPVLEAAACGIPISAINYSAMADTVDKTFGIALEPASIPRDADLQADRAVPNNEMTAGAIFKFLNLDKNLRDKKSKQARKTAEEYFNWDRTAGIWANHFINRRLKNLQGKWDSPAILQDGNVPDKIPEGLSNTQFIQWCAINAAKSPELAVKYVGLNFLDALNTGFSIHGPVSRQNIFEQFKNIGKHKINCELARLNKNNLPQADFIEFANQLEKENNE